MIRSMSSQQIMDVLSAYLRDVYGSGYSATYNFVAKQKDGRDAINRKHSGQIILGGEDLPFALEFSVTQLAKEKADELGHVDPIFRSGTTTKQIGFLQ